MILLGLLWWAGEGNVQREIFMGDRDWLTATADDLVAGAWAASTESGAMFAEPLTAVDRLEGFARSFLLAAIRIAGDNGQPASWCTRYRDALAAGVDPTHADAWPLQTDHGQVTVEATAIAVALHLSRQWIWDQLDEVVQQRLLDWLQGDHWSADNNHVLFGALCQAFCLREGRDVEATPIWAALDRIEEWYVGDGWYTDGDGRRFDHYNAWTFHLYPFWLLDLLDPEGDSTAARRELYRQRLRTFCDGYRHLFADDGSVVAMGRSLIYRFGVLAPFWMAELEGCSPLAPGQTGALARRNVQHFVERGAVVDGLLSLGWHGPHTSVLQSYNTTGSPLWAAKGFLGLLLPAENRAWVDPPETRMVTAGPVVHAGPQWLTYFHEGDGIVRLLNMGSDGHPTVDDPLYRRSLYSSATLPCLELGWADQSIAPIGSRHLGRTSGVVRPDSGAQQVRWLAQGREVVVDHAVAIVEGVELHVARCTGVVGIPMAVGGWHAPDGLPSSLSVLRHDGLDARLENHENPSTALGPASMTRVVVTSHGNELRICWATALGAAVEGMAELVADMDVQWRDKGAVLASGSTEILAAFVTGHRRWDPDSAAQRVHHWS